MKSIAIRYALGVFVITVVWTLGEHVAGYNTTNHAVGQYTRGVLTILYVITVALAIWRVKGLQENTLRFGEGMRTGGILSGLYSVLVTLWFALYAEVINPQYKPSLMAYERKKLAALNLSEANLEARMRQIDLVSGGNVGSYLMLFGFMLAFGLIASLVASVLMQRGRWR